MTYRDVLKRLVCVLLVGTLVACSGTGRRDVMFEGPEISVPVFNKSARAQVQFSYASKSFQYEGREILSEQRVGNGKPIRVAIFGMVLRPGAYELHHGATVFELVLAAGGFKGGADTRTVYVRSGTDQVHKYQLHWFKRAGKVPLVWYGVDGDAAGDLLLDDGMSVDFKEVL